MVIFDKLRPKSWVGRVKPSPVEEFSPLLAEIEEAPVAPLGRVLIYLLVLIVVVVGAWCWWAEIDVIVPAQGILVPEGESKVLQAPDLGILSSIKVRDGEMVREGDILMELDPFVAEKVLAADSATFNSLFWEIARLKAESGGSADRLDAVPDTESSDQLKLLRLGENTHRLSLEELELERTRNQEELAGLVDEARILDERQRIAESGYTRALEVEDIIAKDILEQKKAEMLFIQAETQRLETRKGVLEAQARQIEVRSKGLDSRRRTEAWRELVSKKTQYKETEARVERSVFQRDIRKIRSPVDGVIGKVLVNTLGGVVTAGQPLATIVPKGLPLMAKAKILNKDVGFIRKGLPARIKIEAFEFNKYGTISGKISHVADESVYEESLGMVYEIHIRPDQDRLMKSGLELKLEPGMTIRAEVLTGKRKVARFFLDPVFRIADEGLRVK